MPNRKVEEYAFRYGLSFRKAKKKLGKRRSDRIVVNIQRGAPIAGTGRPKGPAK